MKTVPSTDPLTVNELLCGFRYPRVGGSSGGSLAVSTVTTVRTSTSTLYHRTMSAPCSIVSAGLVKRSKKLCGHKELG